MEFLKTVSTSLEKPQPENTGNEIEDSANRVMNKNAV